VDNGLRWDGLNNHEDIKQKQIHIHNEPRKDDPADLPDAVLDDPVQRGGQGHGARPEPHGVEKALRGEHPDGGAAQRGCHLELHVAVLCCVVCVCVGGGGEGEGDGLIRLMYGGKN
jgi:hypothetical protein